MKFDTICVQGSHTPAENRNTPPVPIYQTTAFSFDTVQYAADLFDLKASGDIYTRLSNPTTQVLEERLAGIEGGVGALCVSSGQSASTIALLNILKAGDEVVASTNMYGGTINLINVTLQKMGIIVHLVSSDKAEDFEKLINEKTKCIFAEVLNNPSLSVLDIEALANVAHKHGLPLIVDNTIPSPYLCQPIKYGADIVVHSLTKYICGHGTCMGGVIVDGGTFNWANGKFPQFTTPDPAYHGLIYSEAFGNKAYITKARVHLMKDLGTVLSPINAFLILQSIESLSLRVNQHCKNALEIAKFLKNHEAVSWVNYPGLEDNENHEMAEKYLNGNYGGIVGFGIKGGLEEGKKFIESVELLSHVANIGDAKSLVIHPASTTHSNMTEEEQLEGGITPDFIRMSVGIEDAEDLIADIDQALKKAVS